MISLSLSLSFTIFLFIFPYRSHSVCVLARISDLVAQVDQRDEEIVALPERLEKYQTDMCKAEEEIAR